MIIFFSAGFGIVNTPLSSMNKAKVAIVAPGYDEHLGQVLCQRVDVHDCVHGETVWIPANLVAVAISKEAEEENEKEAMRQKIQELTAIIEDQNKKLMNKGGEELGKLVQNNKRDD